MSFKVMADNGIDISAKQDGALYNIAVNNQNFICEGLGGEFFFGRTGLIINCDTGVAVVHGRHITADGPNVITLPANETGYLVLRVDLSRPIGEEAYLFATPTPIQEEINWNGNIHDMVLAEFTSNALECTSWVDKRNIISTSGGGGRNIDLDVTTFNTTNLNFKVEEGAEPNTIKLSNDVRFEGLGGTCIDMSRVIDEGTIAQNTEYTMPENGFIVGFGVSRSRATFINGVAIQPASTEKPPNMIYLLKGDTIKDTEHSVPYIVYGVR